MKMSLRLTERFLTEWLEVYSIMLSHASVLASEI